MNNYKPDIFDHVSGVGSTISDQLIGFLSVIGFLTCLYFVELILNTLYTSFVR